MISRKLALLLQEQHFDFLLNSVDNDFYYDIHSEDRIHVKKISKQMLEYVSNNKDYGEEIYQHFLNDINPSEMKVGRFINKFITTEHTDKYVEELVNLYKSNFNKEINDKLSKFSIVKGDDIVYWYSYKRYVGNIRVLEGKGSLNKSCSAHARNIDLFKDNSSVSLIIMKNDDGDKIIGRALLWKLESGEYYMDRVYTVYDSDVNLFYIFAKQNNYLRRNHNNAGSSSVVELDDTLSNRNLCVKLEKCDYKGFPYMDTLCYLNLNSNILTNKLPNSVVSDGTSRNPHFSNNENVNGWLLLQLYGGRGGYVEIATNKYMNPEKDPYDDSKWSEPLYEKIL